MIPWHRIGRPGRRGTVVLALVVASASVVGLAVVAQSRGNSAPDMSGVIRVKSGGLECRIPSGTQALMIDRQGGGIASSPFETHTSKSLCLFSFEFPLPKSDEYQFAIEWPEAFRDRIVEGRRQLGPVYTWTELQQAGFELVLDGSDFPPLPLPDDQEVRSRLGSAMTYANSYWRENGHSLKGVDAGTLGGQGGFIRWNDSPTARIGSVSVRVVSDQEIVLVQGLSGGGALCIAESPEGGTTMGRSDAATAAECSGGW